jgi:VanZ family protein
MFTGSSFAQPNNLMDFAVTVLWMGLIFSLSTATFSSAQTEPFIASLCSKLMPWFAVLNIETAELLIRKMAHLSEYFIFGIIITHLLKKRSGLTPISQIFLVVPFGITYAISDELHQSFVPSRTASEMDVLLDTIGLVCGTFCFYVCVSIRQAKTAAPADISPEQSKYTPSHN